MYEAVLSMDDKAISMDDDILLNGMSQKNINTLDAILRGFFYDDLASKNLQYYDTERDCLVDNVPELIKRAETLLKEAEGTFVGGLIKFFQNYYVPASNSTGLFEAAATKGCQHPILYHMLVRCRESMVSRHNFFEYCLQSISGMLCLIFLLPTNQMG